MSVELKERGYRCSRNRVARLMREAGMGARPRRPLRPKTTQPDHTAAVSPNLLQQADSPTRPGGQIVSDITYIATGEGWLYLVVIIDLFSPAIIGWDLSNSLAAEGLIRAAKRANGSGLVHPAAIFHSDRGCPYTSHRFRQYMQGLSWQQSMSAKGYCYDNSCAESYFASLKTECFPEQGSFESHQQAKTALFDYIETFYNRWRRHCALGMLSPHAILKPLLFQTKQTT